MSRWRVKSNTGCNHWSDEPCERCEAARRRPIAAPLAVSFGEHVFEHIYDPWETPRPITSREELRQETAKREVTSNYLRDSMTFRDRLDRWI